MMNSRIKSVVFFSLLMGLILVSGLQANGAEKSLRQSSDSAQELRRDTQDRPNVLLILVDDLGFEAISSYGGTSYSTPNIDAFAAESVQFTNCHSTPLCTPSRVRLMTGKYSYKNFERFAYLNSDEKTFADFAHQEGYNSCVVGKWQLAKGEGKDARLPTEFGFDDYCVYYLNERAGDRYADPTISIPGEEAKKHEGYYGPDILSDYACDFMEENREKPFFLYYPMVLTHNPFVPTPDSKGGLYEDETGVPSVGMPDLAPDEIFEFDKLTAHPSRQRWFGDMVAYTDKVVGKLLKKLDDLELEDNTLVLFTADNGSHPSLRSMLHGKEWQGGKGKLYEFGTHVPLIARWRQATNPGHMCDDLVDLVDVFATVTDAIGVDKDDPSHLLTDGRSLKPQIHGEKGNPRDHLFLHYDPSHGGILWNSPLTRYVRTKKWKLYNDGRLYDVRKDRLEKEALPANSHPDVRARLSKYLNRQPPVDEAVTPSVRKRSEILHN